MAEATGSGSAPARGTGKVLQAASEYVDAGFLVLPIPYRQKKPEMNEWQTLRLTAEDLPRYFASEPQNIAILLGDSTGTADVDLDCLEAVRAARFFLPETGMVFGRESKPASHSFYRVDPPIPTLNFKDIDEKAMILELRCQKKDGTIGFHTVVPPSTHKDTGELIRFEKLSNLCPANVDRDVLVMAVKRTAAAAILARHWPAAGQGRHNAMLALAGVLVRAEWSEADTKVFCRAVYNALSNPDPAARGRSDGEVESSIKRKLEGGEYTGWPHLREAVGEDVAKRVTTWLGLTNVPFNARVEDRHDLKGDRSFSRIVAPWPAPMKAEAFYGIAGHFLDLVAAHTEADPHLLLLMFLAYAGNVIGRQHYVMAGGDAHYPNLYLCGVGPTSAGRKGSAISPVEMFFTKGDRAPGLGNKLPSLSTGEGLIWAIRDEVWGKQQKRNKAPETVLLHDGVEDKRLIVSMGEFMGALQVMRRQGNTLSTVVRSAWESGILVSPTKNSPAKATGAHVTITGMISKEELLRAVQDLDAENGLLNRFLWCCSRRSRVLPEGGRLYDVVESPQWRSLQEDFNRNSPRGERRVARDADAADLWGRDSSPDRGVYAELSRERFGLAGTVTARAPAQVLRLSLLYASLDGSVEIRREHLDAGLSVWHYCEESARYVFGDAMGDPTADAILNALRASENGMTRTEIRDHFYRKKQESELTRALYLLHQKGLARFVREETGGRSAERWFATGPATKGGFEHPFVGG